MGHPTPLRRQMSGFRSLFLTALLICLALAGPAFAASAQSTDRPVTLTTVRFVHAVPEAPNVDVLIDEQPAAQSIAFGTFTEYVTIEPGKRSFQVVAAGEQGTEPMVETSSDIDEGSSYIITVLGQIGDVRIKVNEVKLSALDPGKARVRLIHASPDAGAVALGIAGGDRLFKDVKFDQDTEYKVIDAGSYGIEIQTEDGPGVSTSLDAMTGRVYDLILLGLAGSQSLTILPMVTNVSPLCSEILGVGGPGDACVRIVHAQPELGVADAAIAGQVVARGLEYGQASDFVAVPAGDDLPITVAAPDQPAGDGAETFDLRAGQAYDIVAWTDAGQATVTSGATAEIELYQVDLTPLPEHQARVRFIHAAPDAGEIDLVIPSGATDPRLFGSIDRADASSYEVLNEGTYPVEVRFAGERGSFFQAQIELLTGIVYEVVAIGRVEDGSFTLLVLTVPAEIRSDRATPPADRPGATPVTAQILT